MASAVADFANEVLRLKDLVVPKEVRDQMCTLDLQEVIPKTTLPMRQQAKKCIRSQYAVPQFLSNARDYN